jgi:hypothetical protein
MKSHYNKFPRNPVPDVLEPKITVQWAFTTQTLTLFNPPASVVNQLMFGPRV